MSRPKPMASPALLTPRERECMDAYLFHGSQKGVARSLGIAEATVQVHMRRLRQRLGVSLMVHAVVEWTVYRTANQETA